MPAPDYFDVQKCWLSDSKTGAFQGALAMYRTGRDSEAIIFSGLCRADNGLSGLERAFRVRVRCVNGIDALEHCKPSTSRPEFDQDLFYPGVSPEFPDELYAIRGSLSSDYQKEQNRLVFDGLEVIRSQKLPKEMFGAFMYYPNDRRQYVQTYLQATNLSSDGYKVSK